ncbi:glycoside hydrolase family 127 protein [Chitinophaga sp.]|uniref:aceric acid hydrolase n=1 Tax=Chitinophaga sp. TaxID=1869181 RepID=UPI0031D6600C
MVLFISLNVAAQSPYAKLHPVDAGAVQWTSGFWADRFSVCKNTMVPQLWATYHDPQLCHSYRNFEIAAGLDTGHFVGPSFHDGDFYKTLEAVAAMYAGTKDPLLDKMMDTAIAVIAKAQRPDGYIYTKAIIEGKGKFDDKLSFESYNFGHLMTAACVHYRATGKTSLLTVAEKAADFLDAAATTTTPAVCPSHYMGLIDLYRTTGNQKYLALAERLIDLRGKTAGTDDNSDRVAFRRMQRVAGHAVRANYLFAGAADLYAETGDSSLLNTLDRMWVDVTDRKMYVTGGCGALYDGVSVDGISYNPDTVQKVHQAYGRNYQLPNLSAHNETCANIGNMLWNRRMLELTGDAKYADVVELALYNSVLSGVSLDGTSFFYTNPLAASADYPYTLRWAGGRQPYIALSNCCPPNVVRTIAEVSGYMYSIGADGLYVDLYGGNTLDTKDIRITQTTDYPWDGRINIAVEKAPASSYGIHLRIPGWCKKARLTINDKPLNQEIAAGAYLHISRKWKPGDKISLVLDMPATLIAANPLVEECKNQVALKKGPLVYCLESTDLAPGQTIADITVPAKTIWQPKPMKIGNEEVIALQGIAHLQQQQQWYNTLYQELNNNSKPIIIKLIPYFAWANRGKSDMSVWLPLAR